MNYPRIYSFSTVGIRNHYIQDYLFHPVRTDFVGGNGSGKSIIADLLQILFIYDASLIRFGTDGVDRDKRNLHTLPYKTSAAYCFINVEIQPGRFVLLGVCISAQPNARPVPFIILGTSDITKPLDQCALTTEQLLFAKDFITEKKEIPVLADVAKALQAKHDLYLTVFKTKDEIKQYYHYLFIREILPINLSQEESLKAFARVIQSFSKAKSLHLNTSESIKNFLFEDSDKDPGADYEEQKYQMEKLLREFDRLSKYITVLEDKQKKLVQLKILDDERQVKNKLFRKAEVIETSLQSRLLTEREHELDTLLEMETVTEESLSNKMDKIPGLKLLAADMYYAADEAANNLGELETKLNELEQLETAIIALKLVHIPTISSEDKSKLDHVDISIREVSEISDLVKKATATLKKYTSLSGIESAYDKQQKEFQSRKTTAEHEKETAQALIDILNKKNDNDVLALILNKKQALSLKQETALLKYIHTPTTRPTEAADGYRYITTDQFIDEINIEEDSRNGGVWLSFGNLREFIKFRTTPRLFDNIGNATDTTQRLREMADRTLSRSNDVLAELDKIQKGKPYSSIIIETDFDLPLMEYSYVEEVKEGLSCAIQIGEKIKQQSEKKDAVTIESDAIISELPFANPKKDMAEIKYRLAALKKHRMKRVTRFAELGGELQNKKDSSAQRITNYKSDQTNIIIQNLAAQKKIGDLNLAYYTRFLENILPEEIQPLATDLGSIQRDYETAEKNYTLKYIEMVALYDETKEEKNAEINIQVKNETYAFDTLKNVLLGSRIKHTDQVGNALTQANLDRLTIADNIKESMMRIFDKTLHKYREYDDTVKRINAFFKGKKISGSFYFKVNFTEHPLFKIKFLEELTAGLTYTHKKGELAFSQSVNEFIEDFFQKVSNITAKVSVYDLLNPKTFFQLSVHLTDEMNEEISGSTGQTYSAIALLGIARLSLVQVEKRKGLRFIILEEIGSLDAVNFNTFPAIAEEYHYQIITMAPKPFGANISEEWYVHHLIPGKQDININHNPPASYFKTKEHSEDLKIYQKNQAS